MRSHNGWVGRGQVRSVRNDFSSKWSWHSGHYICYAKHDDDWFYCNDEAVYRVHENEVRHNRDAYVLFYIRQDSAGRRDRNHGFGGTLPRDETAQGVSAEASQLAGDDDPVTEHDPTSPLRGDVSTPGDPRECNCSWGSTPPAPQPAQADTPGAARASFSARGSATRQAPLGECARDARHTDVVGSR